jgi:hypothetical protein
VCLRQGQGRAVRQDIQKFRQIACVQRGPNTTEVCEETIAERTTVPEESEQDITLEELEKSIDISKANKAAGEDDIPYEFLKMLGPKAKQLLLHLFNRCWRGEGVPTKWRTAIIKPLLKDGKDPRETTSYRPISLTSCLGKTLEKIIADRLTFLLEKRGLLNDNQAGFRQNRCTTDQVLKLTQETTDHIHREGESNRTMTAFFDYEKA